MSSSVSSKFTHEEIINTDLFSLIANPHAGSEILIHKIKYFAKTVVQAKESSLDFKDYYEALAYYINVTHDADASTHIIMDVRPQVDAKIAELFERSSDEDFKPDMRLFKPIFEITEEHINKIKELDSHAQINLFGGVFNYAIKLLDKSMKTYLTSKKPEEVTTLNNIYNENWRIAEKQANDFMKQINDENKTEEKKKNTFEIKYTRALKESQAAIKNNKLENRDILSKYGEKVLAFYVATEQIKRFQLNKRVIQHNLDEKLNVVDVKADYLRNISELYFDKKYELAESDSDPVKLSKFVHNLYYAHYHRESLDVNQANIAEYVELFVNYKLQFGDQFDKIYSYVSVALLYMNQNEEMAKFMLDRMINFFATNTELDLQKFYKLFDESLTNVDSNLAAKANILKIINVAYLPDFPEDWDFLDLNKIDNLEELESLYNTISEELKPLFTNIVESAEIDLPEDQAYKVLTREDLDFDWLPIDSLSEKTDENEGQEKLNKSLSRSFSRISPIKHQEFELPEDGKALDFNPKDNMLFIPDENADLQFGQMGVDNVDNDVIVDDGLDTDKLNLSRRSSLSSISPKNVDQIVPNKIVLDTNDRLQNKVLYMSNNIAGDDRRNLWKMIEDSEFRGKVLAGEPVENFDEVVVIDILEGECLEEVMKRIRANTVRARR